MRLKVTFKTFNMTIALGLNSGVNFSQNKINGMEA